MPPIVIYTTRRTPPGRAVELTAKLIGLELEVKWLDLTKKEHLTPEYLKMNPQHTIPTMTDNGVPLFDSHSIMIYLVSKYAKNDDLYPEDLVMRARINSILFFEAGVMFPRVRAILEPVIYQGSTEIPQVKVDAIHAAYDLLEATLQSDYLVGDRLTLADISVSTSLSTAAGLFPVDSGKYPKLAAYMKHLEKNMPHYQEFNVQRATEGIDYFWHRMEFNKQT
ncbi:glutathione S-transferase 1-1-like [Uranotaenia lowii]|uniref:glutathione S-transferase 1-1-like n=1 Tax=Uranotaenia lowii TaxID=190385 RepID=UPI00247ACD43|nr:glutathione S-transferase 1-1-like [Uranotaenia lowii]